METENKQPIQKKNNLPGIIAAIVGIAVVGMGAWFQQNTKKSESSKQNDISQSQTTPLPSEKQEEKKIPTPTAQPPSKPSESNKITQGQIEAQQKNYKDGAYSTIGNYTSPAGEEQVAVSLTLKNGVVTNTEFTGKATHPASKKWQETFSAGYKEKVIGKSINELSLVAVSGASLATKGFMDAVEEIKQQAGK